MNDQKRLHMQLYAIQLRTITGNIDDIRQAIALLHELANATGWEFRSSRLPLMRSNLITSGCRYEILLALVGANHELVQAIRFGSTPAVLSTLYSVCVHAMQLVCERLETAEF